MRRMTFVRIALLAVALLASAEALAAKGRMGFGITVEISGRLSPVLKSMTANRVVPGSPAANAGLRDGDRIVDLDGSPIAGAPARATAAKLQTVEAGQHVRLGVQRAGSRVAIEIVAAPAP